MLPLLAATLIPALLADDAPPKRRSLAPLIGWEILFQGMSFEERKAILRAHAKTVAGATCLEDVKDVLETFLQMHSASGVYKVGFYTRGFIVPANEDYPASAFMGTQCPKFGYEYMRPRVYYFDDKSWEVWSYDDDRALLVRKPAGALNYELVIVRREEIA